MALVSGDCVKMTVCLLTYNYFKVHFCFASYAFSQCLVCKILYCHFITAKYRNTIILEKISVT